MHHPFHSLAHPGRAVEGDRHELCGMIRPFDRLEALVARLIEHRGREGHELRPAEALVQPVIHRRVRRLIQDRAVSKGARTILHSSVGPGDDEALGQKLGDSIFQTIYLRLRCQAVLFQGHSNTLFRKIGTQEDIAQGLRITNHWLVKNTGRAGRVSGPNSKSTVGHTRMDEDAFHFRQAVEFFIHTNVCENAPRQGRIA